MSIRNLTTENDINLFCSDFECKNMICDNMTIPTGGDLNAHDVKIDNDYFRVAATKYNSQRGYGLDITSAGVGQQTFSIVNSLDDAFVESDDNFGFNESWTEY